uniref:Uncharacterized protein n=1 Tax=Manihot esculenta TaxID=3983 RepID=A0A2C9VAG3_MANES
MIALVVSLAIKLHIRFHHLGAARRCPAPFHPACGPHSRTVPSPAPSSPPIPVPSPLPVLIRRYMTPSPSCLSVSWPCLLARSSAFGDLHFSFYIPVLLFRMYRGATRGLPKRSPILVLLSPKHV